MAEGCTDIIVAQRPIDRGHGPIRFRRRVGPLGGRLCLHLQEALHATLLCEALGLVVLPVQLPALARTVPIALSQPYTHVGQGEGAEGVTRGRRHVMRGAFNGGKRSALPDKRVYRQ